MAAYDAANGGNEVTTSDTGLFYFYTDHLGSVGAISDANGAVQGDIIRYEPFGQLRSSTPSSAITDRGYTGHKENREIGLTYMNARYYIPEVGRFASADTIVPDPLNPQSFNRYAYVLNNPLKYTDPSGHCFVFAGLDTVACLGIWAAAGALTAVTIDNSVALVTQQKSFTQQGAEALTGLILEGVDLIEQVIGVESIPLEGARAKQILADPLVQPGPWREGYVLEGESRPWVESVSQTESANIVQVLESRNKINPAESPVWDSFDPFKGNIKTTGKGRKQRYYQWDYTHGDIEVYDSKKKHLGSMDPITGEIYKNRVSGRKLEW